MLYRTCKFSVGIEIITKYDKMSGVQLGDVILVHFLFIRIFRSDVFLGVWNLKLEGRFFPQYAELDELRGPLWRVTFCAVYLPRGIDFLALRIDFHLCRKNRALDG